MLAHVLIIPMSWLLANMFPSKNRNVFLEISRKMRCVIFLMIWLVFTKLQLSPLIAPSHRSSLKRKKIDWRTAIKLNSYNLWHIPTQNQHQLWRYMSSNLWLERTGSVSSHHLHYQLTQTRENRYQLSTDHISYLSLHGRKGILYTMDRAKMVEMLFKEERRSL